MKRVKRIIAVLILIIVALLLSYLVYTYRVVVSNDISEIATRIGERYG